MSSEAPEQTIRSAMEAHDEGIHIFSIGVGLADYRELDGIATPPASENSFKVATFEDLQNVDDILLASACPSKGNCMSHVMCSHAFPHTL